MNNELTIDLKDALHYTSKYNDKKISEDLYNYITDEIKGLSIKKNLCIKIYTDYPIDDDKKQSIMNMIRSNFESEIQEKKMLSKYMYFKCFLLTIIGFFGVILSYALEALNTTILPELFLIVGWVGIWEALYILLFDEVRERITTKRFRQIVNADIVFIAKEESVL